MISQAAALATQSSAPAPKSRAMPFANLQGLVQKLPPELHLEIANIAAENRIDQYIAMATNDRTIPISRIELGGGGRPRLANPRYCFSQLLKDSQQNSFFLRAMTKRLGHDRYLNTLLTTHANLASSDLYFTALQNDNDIRSSADLQHVSKRNIASFKFCRELDIGSWLSWSLPLDAVAVLAPNVHTLMLSHRRAPKESFKEPSEKINLAKLGVFNQAKNLVVRGYDLRSKDKEIADLKMPSLQNVVVNDCNIGQAEFAALVQMIKNNNSIQTAHFGANAIGTKTVERAFPQPSPLQWHQGEGDMQHKNKFASVTFEDGRKITLMIGRQPSQEWAKFDLFD